MYFKLSLRNVKKSFSNYTLYFLTLSFGVCLFYVFNSIEAQKAMMHISESAFEIMKSITRIMNVISVFISFILGFLIVYANNFLIKRRKREFGVYMTLGMEKSKVSAILIIETFVIGIFSLTAGLLAGIFLSQGLSVVTASLFQVDMTAYTFIFSLNALLKTILYFGIIFLIAIAVNTLSISKYKLIDLINAGKQNEKQWVRKPIITFLMIVLAIIFIGLGYKMALKYGIATFDRKIIIECILGAVGTFLLFASLSGSIINFFKANEGVYYRRLNMFIMRQISSRINTAYISMSFISLMLFVTIGIFSTAIGMTSVLNKGYADAAPFDISVRSEGDVNIIRELSEKNGIDVNKYASGISQYKIYKYKPQALTAGLVFQKVEKYLPQGSEDTIQKKIYPLPIYFMTLSDYNKILDLKKEQEITLADNQAAVLTQFAWADADYQECLKQFIAQGNKLNLNGTEFSVYPQLQAKGIENDSDSMMLLIFPDKMAADGAVVKSVLCFDCQGDSIAQQDSFLNAFKASPKAPSEKMEVASKNAIVAQGGGSKAIIAFVGIYVGIIFLITSAAVLAMQQLSEAADNKHRYAILKKIGADNKQISQAIFKQTAIYFLIPLAVACIHSIVGIKVANDAVRMVGSLNATANTLVTASIILFVYGAYFIATYCCSRNIILHNKLQ
ncbi:ABC-type transport system, involved in lipoprotein release, permease component [Desulfosporosinus orientis DSM 765]|uniref:ABC-type transport system, involved in lipoprotein release, permease component n=1 Tax=Desulfosporosinus orientis (strain ATCC 19365 / DSM 765 / NCIMB 8382 / VKM B-1628 / Singapore I) TaxID=768706 RepID=G7WAW7_DESOD|nr:ABC transporter permease [Desulfosporosinus orientis]AET67178.1 ABC-type transport system, involved in lipoprotein release, permease component [Desulfosporosinus orientis DSM 765]